MSPIDRELEQALASRAANLVPPGDLLAGVEREARGLRRRRGAAVGAAALSVLAIAVAVPLATRDTGTGDPGAGFATAQPSAAPSPRSEPSRSPAEPRAELGWEPRGPITASSELLLTDRVQVAMDRESTAPAHAFSLLWGGTLPDGRAVLALELWSEPAYVLFYVENADRTGGRIVQKLEARDRNPQAPAGGTVSETRLPQVSAYIDGPEDFVVVVGAPGTRQLEFSTDGRRYTTVETVDGVGIVGVTKGENRGPYAVRVYDGNGVVVYDGPIDLLSED